MDERYGSYSGPRIIADQGVKDHVVLPIADHGRLSRRRIVDQSYVEDVENNVANSFEPSPSTEQVNTSTSRHVSRGLNILIVFNLLLEVASAFMDQFASPSRPLFAFISLLMSVLSVVLSTADFIYKTRAHKARFMCKWPVPWFYYTVLLFCAYGHLISSAINYSFIHRGQEGPIKISWWPLFFAIGMFITMLYIEYHAGHSSLQEVYVKPAKEREPDPADEIEMNPAEEIETNPAEENEMNPAEEIDQMNPAEEIETNPAEEIERDGLDDDMDQWGNQKSKER